MKRRVNLVLICLLPVLLTTASAFSGTTGKVAGRVLDKETGDNDNLNRQIDGWVAGLTGAKTELEPNDFFATATPIVDNTEPLGNFSSEQDVDIWRLEMTTDSIYHIYSVDADMPENVHVELYFSGDTTTNILNGSPDGRGLANNFRIAGWAPFEHGSGTYYLRVNHPGLISGAYSGDYKIRYISQSLDFWANLHEPDNSFQEALSQNSLPIDGSRFFGMCFNLDSLPTGKDDVDFFTIAGEQGKRLWVETEPVQGYPNIRDMDSKIWIWDGDGNQLITENDDKSNQEEDFGFHNLFSLAVVDSLPYTGLYYVTMSSFYSTYNDETHSDSGPSTGNYVLYSFMGARKDEVEPNDTFEEATPIVEAISGSQVGGNNNIVIDANFSIDGDDDYFAFNLKSVKMYSFNTANSSVGSDITLEVYSRDDPGTNLVDNTVIGRYNSNDFRLSGWSPPKDGIYVLKVSPTAGAVGGANTGDYQLRMGWATWRNASLAGEPDNDQQGGAVEVEFDSSNTYAAIYPAADEDWFSFVGAAGDIIHVETFSGQDSDGTWGRDLDTRLTLVDPSGNIVENDDYRPGAERHPGNTFSGIIDYTLQGSGMVRVKVEGSDKGDGEDGKNAVGTYRLFVNSSAAVPAVLERENNDAFARAMQIAEGKDVGSAFSSAADVDIFAIEMATSRMYFVSAYDDAVVDDIHADLFAASDTTTNVLDSSIDGRYRGGSFRLSGFIPSADERYYLKLSNSNPGRGSYTLRARSADIATVGSYHEPDNSIAEADARGDYPIDGVPMTGALYNAADPQFEHDIDIYRFNCTAGQMLGATLTPVGGPTWDRDTDTYMMLVSAAGDTIAENDDATGTYSTIGVQIPADGIYYLRVYGYYSSHNGDREATHRNPGIGDYVLTVKGVINEIEPNNSAEQANLIPIADNNLIEASFATDDLEDWFKVDLDQTKVYYFNTTESRLADEIKVEVFAEGTSTNVIDADPFSGFDSGDFRLCGWSPPTTGMYLFKLSVLIGAIDEQNNGTYKLRAAGGEVLAEVAALHEPDNSLTKANAQSALSTDGTPFEAAFGDNADLDIFAIEGIEGHPLEIITSPAHGPRWIRELDTVIGLFNQDSVQIASNDDYDDYYEEEFYLGEVSNSYSRINIEALPYTGTYYVRVTPYYGAANGREASLGDNAVGSYLVKAEMGVVTGVEDRSLRPEVFALEQNYPNPFNPSTTIQYSLPEPVDVKLTIFNIMGQRVATLVDGVQQAGYYNMLWNATNKYGVRVSTGVYFYILQAGDKFVKTKKMLLIK
jgi:hypothetical protein